MPPVAKGSFGKNKEGNPLVANRCDEMFHELYLKAVEEAGLRMMFYKRYVDDIKQIVCDETEDKDGEEIASKLKKIANNVMD